MSARTWIVAVLAASIGYGVAVVEGAWADDDEHEEEREAYVELEDVEDVLEAVEALSQGLITPSKAIEEAQAKSDGVPVDVTLGSEPRDGKLVAVWEVSLLVDL